MQIFEAIKIDADVTFGSIHEKHAPACQGGEWFPIPSETSKSENVFVFEGIAAMVT
jgi:hypothetical protein